MQKLLQRITHMEDKDTNKLYDSLRSKLDLSQDRGFNYSDIAQFVFGSNGDDIEYLLKNLESIKAISRENNDDIVKNGINKIKNHIELEVCRLEYLEKKQKKDLMDITQNTLTDVKSMGKTLKEYDKKFDKNNKEITNWYANIITILGLFAAIVVTFFGGLGSINSIFSGIGNVSKYRLVFVVLIVAFSMFNIVFMLLYYISIITNKSLNKDCSNTCDKFNAVAIRNENSRSRVNRDVTICINKKLICSIKRYPLIAIFNFLILSMLAILMGFYIFKV